MAKKKTIVTDFGDAPPIIYTMENDQYHNASGVSRSELWKLYKKTPASARYGQRDETEPMKLGSAAGMAILEPDLFETKYARGPDAARNTREWKNAEADTPEGVTLMKPAEFDAALCMRESAHATSSLRKLLTGAEIEQAAFVIDDETGLLVKVKPDLYSPLQVVCDIKTAASAAPDDFARAIGRYGYHFQESMYWHVWSKCRPVDGFVFIVMESEPPYLVAQYELPPEAHREGMAIYRESLAAYKICVDKDEWPGYPDRVVPIQLKPWDYMLTNPKDD